MPKSDRLSFNPAGVRLELKASSALEDPLRFDANTVSLRPSPATGVYGQFGADLRRCYVPLALKPTKTFHQRVTNAMRRRGFNLEGERFPAVAEITQRVRGRVNLRMHLYPPAILITTVDVEFLTGSSLTPNDLIEIQLANEASFLRTLLSESISEALRNSADPIKIRNTSNYPALQITTPWSVDEFEDGMSQERREIIALLIRHRDPSSIGDDLINRIWVENAPLNAKSSHECMLVNKQGILYLTPTTTDPYRVHHLRRSHDLGEIAITLGLFLNEYSTLRLDYPNFADFIGIRVRDWIEHPAPQLWKSVSNTILFELFEEKFSLATRLATTELSSLTLTDDVRAKLFEGFADGWWSDTQFYETIEDEVSKKSETELAFVKDLDLRTTLTRDIRESRRARSSRHYKSALVLAGSVVESALLERLRQSAPNESDRLVQMDLDSLGELAILHGILPDTVEMKDSLATLASYKKLIHPLSEIRTAMQPSSQRADLGIAAMELIIQEMG